MAPELLLIPKAGMFFNASPIFGLPLLAFSLERDRGIRGRIGRLPGQFGALVIQRQKMIDELNREIKQMLLNSYGLGACVRVVVACNECWPSGGWRRRADERDRRRTSTVAAVAE